MSAHQD